MEIDEDNSKEEMSDPDDIDALLESMEIDEDNTKEEMSDPDDIDALLESMEIDEGNTKEEMSDPDDIDALLESMATENELDEEPKTEKLTDEKESLSDEALAEANNSAEEMSDPDDIDALLESLDINNSHNDEPIDVIDDELTQEENQNSAKIDTLTEEYIAPLLATDFSDIKTKPIEKELVDDNGLKDDSTDDNFDSLIEEAFDEDTLAELMNEQPVEQVTELTPDFSDQNVLASLLNDDNDGKSKVSEATEINDIQELDSLDFDELLANIEEESSIAGQSVDFNENLDAGDDFSLADFDNVTSNTTVNDDQKAIEDDKNYLSVDSLLSDSQNDANYNEPYDKAKIDVGLNEFPEFTDGVNKIDVDIDENGMAAKLDLAKVYIEIGDIDNAHVILHEVVKQGDTQQQVVAQELLDNL
jgi:pilus assembly protein FimV